VSKQDEKFFDTFTLVMGGLVAVAVAIFIFSFFAGGGTQREARLEDETYQQAVVERIAPVGQVRLPGAAAEANMPAEPQGVDPVATRMSGPQVYNAACVACHGPGIGGAPKLGDAAAWTPRLAQGLEVLQRRAIEGYQGEQGYMPPKGGRVDLSDEEVLAAVDFMVEESG
jgi:cytochrome c5